MTKTARYVTSFIYQMERQPPKSNETMDLVLLHSKETKVDQNGPHLPGICRRQHET